MLFYYDSPFLLFGYFGIILIGSDNVKYKEINISEKLFGEGFVVYDWKETDEKITIYLKSTKHEDVCPDCGSTVRELHNTYRRKVQTIPIRNKETILDVIAYKFDCQNESCKRQVVMQELPFVSASQQRADDLNCLILATSMFLSNEGTSKVLKHLGITVSNDSVKRLIDKIIIKDDSDVESVGIDDVAIRKGQSYATAIYDMHDHHLIALLEGRDKETVAEWLKRHDKIKLVARDRATAYAAAISEVLPECTQVADRFHLLQNLIEKMKDIFKSVLPAEIFIEDGKILETAPEKVSVLKVTPDDEILNQYNYDDTAPMDEDGEVIEYDDSATDKNNKQHQQHAESRKKNSD